jgi:tetratricopeptide (TPR) repeat protein
MQGDGAGAIAHAERALAEARRAADGGTAGKAEYILARESFWLSDLRRSVEHGRRAVVLLERAGERWWLATAHWARALSYLLLGRFDEALDSATWARTIADKLRDPRLASQATWTTGWIHATRGDWATGIEAGRRALELAPDEMSRAVAGGFLGTCYLEKGDTGAALPLLEQAAETLGRLRVPQLEGFFTILEGLAHALRRDIDRAAALAARGLDIVRDVNFGPAIVEARLVESTVALARRDLPAARRALDEALELSERIGARFLAAQMRLKLAEVAWADGDRDAAARHLRPAHADFQALAAPVWAARAASLAGTAGIALT